MKLLDKIKNKNAKICVIGIGYMGLPISSLFAKEGFNVTGFDIDTRKVELVNKAVPPFEEKGLKQLLESVVKSSKLKASSSVEEADIFLISVPTPKKEDKADLTYLKKAAESVKSVLKEDNLVIIESTIPPRTCKDIIKPILDSKKVHYYLSHCPERAFPGDTINELIHNDRIIGGLDEDSTKLSELLYSSFVKGKIFLTNITTAELCKLSENTFRDVNIALANELAILCEDIGVNVWELISLANKHPRVNIHQPGPGVGGHCIPKDPVYLFSSSKQAKLIPLARTINDSMPHHVVKVIQDAVKGKKNANIALLGASFKKNVDDSRDSPTLFIADELVKEGFCIKIHDPLVKEFKYKLYNFEDCIQNADIIVLLVDHDYYKTKNFTGLNVYDTRNMIPNASIKLGVGK